MESNPHNNNPPMICPAITYPSMSQQSLRPTPAQPRQPRNLQGLLRFAMEATKAEDAPGNSEIGPLDEERRKFLEEALKSLTVNVVEVLQNSIKVLTDQEKIQSIKQGEPLPPDVLSAFTNLMEYIDDIDIANDFHKMGGFAIFPVCYGSQNEEVRQNASWVLAELCQNNPYCQQRALECGLLLVLLNLAPQEQGKALAKCLYAISCSCREFEPACKVLIAEGGCEILTQLVGCEDLQARTKVAFFVRYLCLHHPDAREIFVENNLVEAIANQIRKGRDETTEHLLSILLLLFRESDPRIFNQCRERRLGLKKLLEDITEHEEERAYCQELLKVFEDCEEFDALQDEEADR